MVCDLDHVDHTLAHSLLNSIDLDYDRLLAQAKPSSCHRSEQYDDYGEGAKVGVLTYESTSWLLRLFCLFGASVHVYSHDWTNI